MGREKKKGESPLQEGVLKNKRERQPRKGKKRNTLRLVQGRRGREKDSTSHSSVREGKKKLAHCILEKETKIRKKASARKRKNTHLCSSHKEKKKKKVRPA